MSDHCKTPEWLYRALDTEFGFDLDPCPLAKKPTVDGLGLDWTGKKVFCNPPYSAILPWVEKALTSAALTVFLVPKRLDAKWGQKLWRANAEFRPLARSFYFERLGGGRSHPLCGSMIVVLNRLDRL